MIVQQNLLAPFWPVSTFETNSEICIQTVVKLCLSHRLRKDPLETIDSGNKVTEIFNEVFEIE